MSNEMKDQQIDKTIDRCGDCEHAVWLHTLWCDLNEKDCVDIDYCKYAESDGEEN